MSEQHKLLEWLMESPEKKVVIASVIRVEGSAYRHQGAQMIIGAEGTSKGLISGGCLEEDLFIRAQKAMQAMEAAVVDYDMRQEDDLGWGKGAGCNGKVYISIEPVDLRKAETIQAIRRATGLIRNGEILYRIRSLDDDHSLPLSYYSESGEALLNHVSNLSKEQVQSIQKDDKPAVYLSGSGRERFLVERIEPKPLVYVFGAGMDVEPLVAQLASLEFSPVVIDTIKERLNRDIFPGAAGFRWMTPGDFFDMEFIPEGSYALVMTHAFQDDRIIVHELLKQKSHFTYMGILGPKRRTRRLLSSSKIPEELHAPVGLDIKAEGAEEIALSIAAQMVQVKRQRQAETHSQKAVM